MKRKYVKDYTEKEYEQKLPGRKKQYVYTGNYFVWTYEKTRKSMLVSYCVLSLLLVVLWIARGMVNSEGTHFVPIELPYIFELIPLVYLCRGIFSCFTYSADKLERFQYDESAQRVVHSSIALFILEGIVVLSEIVFFIMKKGNINWGRELFFLAATAVSMIFVWYLYKVSEKNPCREEKKEEI